MTSNPPAQPRPPPNILAGLARHRSSSSLPTAARVTLPPRHDTTDLSMSLEGDERPSKRRRIVSHGSSPVSDSTSLPFDRDTEPVPSVVEEKYSAASWQEAVSRPSIAPAPAKGSSNGPPPLPRPPWGNVNIADPLPLRVRTSCRYRADIPVPNKPDSLQCSSTAPLLDQQRPADYFPWTGNHLEDVINEKNVKEGYHDRPPHPAERETNTAKAPLYNAFKHRSGLETLSALFTLVLEKKSKHGALSSISTFRPPPRVTLTEAKRKSWIADLANGDVPLRRLSRTIPQGVRGLPLLEQCLLHRVPINRAIWFVKCVGANEIRTLKRKGVNPNVTVGAENKWLRDWTLNIEQFMEAIIGQCAPENWFEKIRYCFHLAARLYQENLLERDHFLEWIIKSFTTCTMESVAAWLPFVQLFRVDLIRFRKRARQLAGVLLQRLKQLSGLNAVKTVLGEKLRTAVRGLAISKPACFLMPDEWQQYRNELEQSLDMSNDHDQRVFDAIELRNERLLGGDLKNSPSSTHDKEVFNTLDAATAPFHVAVLSERLLGICSDIRQLGDLCLEWATSRFRGHSARIYLVARLLRRWQKNGFDIDSAIHAFYNRPYNATQIDWTAYRHLLAELSRSRSFSRSRFLRNMSIRGMNDSNDKFGTCFTILHDLYLDDAEDHLVNLRDHLLGANRLLSDAAQDLMQTQLSRLSKAIAEADTHGHVEHDTAVEYAIDVPALEQLDWSAKFGISTWLRAEALQLGEVADMEVIGKPPLPGSRPFSLAHFQIIREALEAMGDVAVLADVLHALSCTKQEVILASLVDTVHYNAAALSAIGALEPLQKLYGQSYIAMRNARPCILLFATALTDLCQHYPCSLTPLRALQQDLIKGDRGRALAACSPFSDGVAESLQQAGETFNDDFEAILLGEPNMSEQTMTSLFSVLVGRIMKNDVEAMPGKTFTLCQLLARLRLFRPAQGDALIRKWLTRLFSAVWSSTHQGIVTELLYTRCVTFSTLLDLAYQAPLASKCKQAIRDMVANSLLSPHTQSGRPQQEYVLKISAHRLLTTDTVRVLDILLTQNNRGPRMFELCSSILSNVLDDEKELASLSPIGTRSLAVAVDELLGLRANSEDAVTQLFRHVTWLSLPYCCYRLPALAAPKSDEAAESQSDQQLRNIYEALREQLGGRPGQGEKVQALVRAMPATMQDQLRALSENQFYESVPRQFPLRASTQLPQSISTEKDKLADAITEFVLLGHARAGSATSDGNVLLIEKLTMAAKMLNIRGDNLSNGAAIPSSPISPAVHPFQPALSSSEHGHREFVLNVVDFLNMLLHVASMKASQFTLPAGNTTGLSKPVQNQQIKLVALLSSIATQPSLVTVIQSNSDEVSKSKVRDCMSFALDIAARMVDDLSEEARAMCARILKDRLRDERIMWLVGCMSSYSSVNITAGNGLIMMHEMKGSMGDFRPKQWEMLESGGGKESDTCLGLGLFGAKQV